MTVSQATTSDFTIGRDVRPIGRWFRLIVGLYTSFLIAAVPLIEHPVPTDEAVSYLGGLGLYFVLVMGVYLLAFYFLGERVLAQTNPWVSTLIMLGPLVLVLGQLE